MFVGANVASYGLRKRLHFFYVPVLVKLRVAVLTFNLILVDYVFMFHWLVVYVKII